MPETDFDTSGDRWTTNSSTFLRIRNGNGEFRLLHDFVFGTGATQHPKQRHRSCLSSIARVLYTIRNQASSRSHCRSTYVKQVGRCYINSSRSTTREVLDGKRKVFELVKQSSRGKTQDATLQQDSTLHQYLMLQTPTRMRSDFQ